MTHAICKVAPSAALSPDQLKQLARTERARARRAGAGDERLRRLALAEALNDVAAIKSRLLDYERRLLN